MWNFELKIRWPTGCINQWIACSRFIRYIYQLRNFNLIFEQYYLANYK